jgi:hypothetical protein
MNNINQIEEKFKNITGVPQDVKISYWPITEHIGFNIRTEEKQKMGEVFTPLQLVDKMISKAQPHPRQFNLDLCAGHGQFTVRILRYFVNQFPNFNIQEYLSQYHWFNELNPESVFFLQEIFGENINIAAGPAEALKNYPKDTDEIWERGIYYWISSTNSWSKNPKGITTKTLF